MTIQATVDGRVIEWRDKKRYLWIMGAIIPLIPLMMWGLYAWTGATIVCTFGLVLILMALLRPVIRKRLA